MVTIMEKLFEGMTQAMEEIVGGVRQVKQAYRAMPQPIYLSFLGLPIALVGALGLTSP
jgi:hypothetical protein